MSTIATMQTIIKLGVFVLASCTAYESTATQTNNSPNLPVANVRHEYTVQWPELGSGEERFITIQLGPDTYEHCRNVSPKFPFDAAITYVEDNAQLVALASCLNHPSMSSRSVLLVGRADPRGTDDYNMTLGKKRAAQIKERLVAAGLAADRIEIASRGKLDARGMLPEFSFGYDRRVDVVVTGGAHHP